MSGLTKDLSVEFDTAESMSAMLTIAGSFNLPIGPGVGQFAHAVTSALWWRNGRIEARASRASDASGRWTDRADFQTRMRSTARARTKRRQGLGKKRTLTCAKS
jgi:hypothetical protein